MVKRHFFLLLKLYLLAHIVTFSCLSTANQETRFSRELAAQISVGEAVYLPTSNNHFLAIYTPAIATKSRGGVILLHDIGNHSDWPEVIAPLRQELPKKGWSTLSIQLPLLPDDTLPDSLDDLFLEMNARIKAAIDYYANKGILNLALMGHSFGAIAGIRFLTHKQADNKDIIAFVAISLHANYAATSLPEINNMSTTLAIPTLDILGSRDFIRVSEDAKLRATIAHKNQSTYFSQIILTGADHHFRGLADALINRVAAWLDNQAPSMLLKKK